MFFFVFFFAGLPQFWEESEFYFESGKIDIRVNFFSRNDGGKGLLHRGSLKLLLSYILYSLGQGSFFLSQKTMNY